eukprot:9198402-Lingulodinium_polyedra.AAC.1
MRGRSARGRGPVGGRATLRAGPARSRGRCCRPAVRGGARTSCPRWPGRSVMLPVIPCGRPGWPRLGALAPLVPARRAVSGVAL